MNVSNNTAKKVKAAAPPPQIVNIGYEGDIMYGVDMVLDSNKYHTPVHVSYVEDEQLTQNEAIYILDTRIKSHSKLSKLLVSLAQKRVSDDLYTGLETVSFNKNEETNNNYYILNSNDPKAAHERCQYFIDNAIPCSLNVVINAAK